MPSSRRSGYDVIVIGGGITGLTAATQAVELGLSTLLLEEHLLGGQVATVTTIESFPTLGPTSGAELAATLCESARKGGEVVESTASSISGTAGHFKIKTPDRELRCRSILVATGGRLRRLEVPGEEEFAGRGVSHCASCDGPLFRGEDVVVVGGGDSAFQEASLLGPICRSVSIVIRNRLRARRSYVDRVKAQGNIKLIWDTVVEEILGNGNLTAVRLRNLESNTSTNLICSGLFPFLGTVPNTGFLTELLERDDSGRLITDNNYETSCVGIYAAGAVRYGYSGELVSAAGEGAAAMKYIARVNEVA